MLTQVITVVAQQNHNGVVPQIQPIHGFKNLAHLRVDKRDAGMISTLEFALILLIEGIKEILVRKLGVNPDEYLRDIFHQLPQMTNQTVKNYTPAKGKAARDLKPG